MTGLLEGGGDGDLRRVQVIDAVIAPARGSDAVVVAALLHELDLPQLARGVVPRVVQDVHLLHIAKSLERRLEQQNITKETWRFRSFLDVVSAWVQAHYGHARPGVAVPDLKHTTPWPIPHCTTKGAMKIAHTFMVFLVTVSCFRHSVVSSPTVT